MEQFDAEVKRWGNSFGIVIPARLMKRAGLDEKSTVRVCLSPANETPQELTFGALKTGQDLQEAMDGIDEGYDD